MCGREAQIQALDRTQPGLPLKRGRCGTTTHDYKRHGTTTLFAALSLLDGKVIGDCMPRHRHQEFIRFLNVIGVDRFGASAPGPVVMREYGFSVENVCQRAMALLERKDV